MAKLCSAFLVCISSVLFLLSCHHANSFVSRTSTSPITTDFIALLSMKSSISSDPRGYMASWNDSVHFCLWRGVTCGGRRHPERVVLLNLSSLDLVGFISPAIVKLTFLRKIDFSANQIYGFIPQDIGRLFRLRHLNLSMNSLEGEYGMANKVSTHGDVYSYGILLLEMFTGKRPTDDTFVGGLSFRKFVETAFPERIVDVIDSYLLLQEDGEASDVARNLNGARTVECTASVLKIGISCSDELPEERMEMGDVTRELHKVRDALMRYETQGARSRARAWGEGPSRAVM